MCFTPAAAAPEGEFLTIRKDFVTVLDSADVHWSESVWVRRFRIERQWELTTLLFLNLFFLMWFAWFCYEPSLSRCTDCRYCEDRKLIHCLLRREVASGKGLFVLFCLIIYKGIVILCVACIIKQRIWCKHSFKHFRSRGNDLQPWLQTCRDAAAKTLLEIMEKAVYSRRWLCPDSLLSGSWVQAATPSDVFCAVVECRTCFTEILFVLRHNFNKYLQKFLRLSSCFFSKFGQTAKQNHQI